MLQLGRKQFSTCVVPAQEVDSICATAFSAHGDRVRARRSEKRFRFVGGESFETGSLITQRSRRKPVRRCTRVSLSRIIFIKSISFPAGARVNKLQPRTSLSCVERFYRPPSVYRAVCTYVPYVYARVKIQLVMTTSDSNVNSNARTCVEIRSEAGDRLVSFLICPRR